MKELKNYTSLVFGLALVVHGTFTASISKPDGQLKNVAVPSATTIPYKIIHDTVKALAVHDTVFSIVKKTKKIFVIDKKNIDSELVFNSYFQTWMLKRREKAQIIVKEGINKKDTL